MLGRKPSAFCDKFFDRVVKVAFQVYMGTSWAGKLSNENLTFSCSDIERNVFTFVRKFFNWVVRTAFYLAKGLFWEEVSPLSFSPIFFGHWAKNLREFVDCLSTGLSKLHSSCPEAFFALNIFCKKFVEFCLSLSDFQTKNVCFLTEKHRHICQKCILTVHWKNLTKGFLRKSFLVIFRALAKKLRFPPEYFSTRLPKLQFTRLGEHFKNKNFPEKISSFQSISVIEGSIFVCLSKTSQKGCQNCLLHVYRNPSRRRCSYESFRHFRSLIEIFPLSEKPFPPSLSELVSTCRKKNNEAKIIFKKASINLISDFDRIVSWFSSKRFWWGCQSCLLRVHSNILKEYCGKVSDVGQKTIGILWQILRQGCQNCFPGVHGNKLSRKTFRWKPYIFLFRPCAESFHFCPRVFWLGCQNCIPPGNRIILRRTILFEFFLYLFRTLSKKSSGFCRKFINWNIKTAFFASRSVLCVEHLLQEICGVLFITFGLSDKKKLLSGRKITPCLSKVHSDCPLEQFEERVSSEIFFGHF